MAASITANPMRVRVGSGLQSGTTTITWDTGAPTIQGRVFVTVNGAPEKLFDPGGGTRNNTPPPTQTVSLGKTHEFRLKRIPQNTLLASVTVTSQRVFIDANAEATVFMVDSLLKTLGLVQGVYALKVLPSLDYVDFSFRSYQPTVPIVTVTTRPSVIVGTAFPVLYGPQTVHSIRIGGVAGSPRLKQDTAHFYEIVAGGHDFSVPSTAVIKGGFFTGTQTVEIHFDRIRVDRDGDPRSPGDMTFTFGAGDAETKADLGLPWPAAFSDTISDDNRPERDVHRVITIPEAPRRLWVGVIGEDNDTPDIPWPGAGLCTLGLKPVPYGLWTGHAEQEMCEQASVWAEFDTFDNGELKTGKRDIHITPLLKTGNFGVAFTVYGWLTVDALAAETLRMRMAPGKPELVGFSLEVGRVAAVSAARDRVDLVSLGPDGAVYHKTVSSDAPGLPRQSWTRLGGEFTGPVTAIASGTDRVSLFALGPGGVFQKNYVDGVPPELNWEPLGGEFVAPVAAAVGPKGRIELFGLAADGTVFHRTEEARGRNHPASGQWEKIGGEVSGSLIPVYTPRTGLSLFALARDGSIVHRRWSRKDEWESLGGDFKGLLTGKFMDNGTMLLVVLAQGRMVYVMPWENYPEDPPSKRWENIGTIDSLWGAQMPQPERGPGPDLAIATLSGVLARWSRKAVLGQQPSLLARADQVINEVDEDGSSKGVSAAHTHNAEGPMQSRSRTLTLVAVLALVGVLGGGGVTLFAQAADPRIGTWKLNAAKSKYSPGPPPQSLTVKVESSGQGEKVTTDAVNADGSRTTVQYTANFDGKDYPLTGSQIADMVSLKRVDARTTVRTDKKGGKVAQTITRVVSQDGKTMTATVKGTNAQGQPVDNVVVFDKQ